MRKTAIDNPVRRRVAITAAGIAAVAAIAMPGVAWATGGLSETAPVVVSAPVLESAPAMQSDTPNSECGRDLTPEEVDALVAKGEVSREDITPAAAIEPAVVASAEETRAYAEGPGTGEAAVGTDASVTSAMPAC
ncbi:hypothetical protein CJ178_31100 [Rhodococcus sp. ACPA4]|uniref:hypothetical protein n=1 Tax=Rhodococcus sp. ACPA4 TaxID=2028571 RepID=UPI000BB11C33|nr:hypothetical protein [Rhodococcus sp. ACPA4]PBC35888.1 hypothetical protein CJ178_31100 [Rhodococcus sp. ACPA4]